ncbi:MAG TPA: GTPase HflX [Nitrososphaerales archaeon]|nr:GTPase HflX [Nitrososphaerales archaeon]
MGKAEELFELVSENGSDTLIIDESLTSSQANNLAKVTHTDVIDRERLILNIFALRAVTTEAKLQVQLAELRYEMPRARDVVRHSKTGERAGYSGMGELAVDVRFRALKHRMVTVRGKISNAKSSRTLQRKERLKRGEPLVSFAGYTSSGKTTLFNRLASENKEESPNLFTTLATTTRALTIPGSKRRVMLSDTVGFISRLPTYLIESFKSTLEELTFADLVLLVIDASEDPDSVRIKFGSCKDILGQLGADPKRVLLVLNKVDLMKGRTDALASDALFEGFASVRTSATRGDGMRQLRNRIFELTRSKDGRVAKTGLGVQAAPQA